MVFLVKLYNHLPFLAGALFLLIAAVAFIGTFNVPWPFNHTFFCKIIANAEFCSEFSFVEYLYVVTATVLMTFAFVLSRGVPDRFLLSNSEMIGARKVIYPTILLFILLSFFASTNFLTDYNFYVSQPKIVIMAVFALAPLVFVDILFLVIAEINLKQG